MSFHQKLFDLKSFSAQPERSLCVDYMQCWDYALPSIHQETNHEQHYRQDQGHG
jgi:hypothetical protein